jgi:hypothetical protein
VAGILGGDDFVSSGIEVDESSNPEDTQIVRSDRNE